MVTNFCRLGEVIGDPVCVTPEGGGICAVAEKAMKIRLKVPISRCMRFSLLFIQKSLLGVKERFAKSIYSQAK
jgi:hypothetical protein